MDIELIPFVLAANQQVRIERAGRYVEVIDAPYTIASLQFSDDAGSVVAFARNVVSGIYAELAFKGIDIVNGANAQTITLLITDGRGGSRRQPGVVQVVDTGSLRTKAGVAFSYRYSSTGAAGQFPTTTIQNPAGSGKRVVIKGLSLGSSIAGGVSWGFSATGPVVGASILVPRCKLSGAASSSVVVNSSSSVTLYGGTNMPAMDSAFLQASATQQIQLQEPVVLAPGDVFVIGGENVAQQIAGRVEFYEESV